MDLALNHRTLQDPGYRTICRLLTDRGYRQDERQPFIFWRTVRWGDREIHVEVDLLAGEYEGTGKRHRTQRVQDVRARKTRGCELALQFPMEVPVAGLLPDGSRDSARVRIAAIVPFLAMKGIALSTRMKEKDAWDIYYCVRYYPGGPDALVETCRAHMRHRLVAEGFERIAEKFASPDHSGPKWVADFDEVTDPETREEIQRDAYERVHHLLQAVGMA